jgi:hypothetical protein
MIPQVWFEIKKKRFIARDFLYTLLGNNIILSINLEQNRKIDD